MHVDIPRALTPVPAFRSTWRDRLCARLGGVCELLRAAHAARIPF